MVSEQAPHRTSRPASKASVSETEIDALQTACRALVAISARSIAAVEDKVDLAQFRALVVIASRGSVSLGELAEATRTHLSTASRLCDRLVSEDLLNRADDPANRRQLLLTLTGQGEAVVAEAMAERRAAMAPMLNAMPVSHRRDLVRLLGEFAAAGPQAAESDLWSMGWTT